MGATTGSLLALMHVCGPVRYWGAIYTSQRSKKANLKQGKKKVIEVVENTAGKQEFKED
ncbi:hypothetical protein BVRB_5g125030 [Beta vulgaris subsp. vulgaris]|uniref:Uncharacterized protein n=1 Tax=Beta vulgaris subsp. vulgaris TaxID=3555 RepID=A0A0J8B8P7_BETVV|nr:hypothetical protein BVRB_5g125030 [Beta vulgaris subsp. vulgaris]